MAQVRSFKDFVANHFYNEIFELLDKYIRFNPTKIECRTYSVSSPSRAKLDDFRAKSIHIHNCVDNTLLFDLIVEADIIISERNGHHKEEDQSSQWFKVACSAELNTELRNFVVRTVSLYFQKSKTAEFPMTDTLVPVIARSQLDNLANSFLQKYYPEALANPIAIPVDEVANRMGLGINRAHLSKDCSVFGQILFIDSHAQYFDSESNSYRTVEVKAGTIFVDPHVFFMRNVGSVNNTIIHECVHWEIHRKAMELERLYDNTANVIRCQVVEGNRIEKRRTPLDWMEWQANALAPRILMPADQFRTMAEKYIQQQKDFQNTSKSSDVIEMVIQDLSNFFKVSKQAAKIRLIDLGYEEAIGALTYIDDRYITNYTFTPGALKRNQTYAIPLQDALTEYAVNPELRQLIDTGRFLYVDAHYCINDPQYIEKEEDGSAKLTEYALNHVDECCLAFDITFRRNASFGAVAYNDYILFKNAVSDSYPELHFQNSGPNKDISDRADQLASFSTEAGNLARINGELPATFSKTLVSLMDTLGYTVENLAEKAQLSDRHIRNWRNTETAPKSLRAVVAVCIGMQLHPILSHDLIHKSGHSFMNTEEHIVYQMILNSCYMKSIFECSDYLTACGFRPFNSDQ
jgi:hypothetical protein